MNRLAATGLLDEAKAGKTVLVVDVDLSRVQHAFYELEAIAGEDAEIRHTNGRERIAFEGGGAITFCGARNADHVVRGRELDLVYVEHDADQILRRTSLGYESLLTALSARRGGIVRA